MQRRHTMSKSINQAVCTEKIKFMEEKPELVCKCHDLNVKTKSNEDLTHPIRLVTPDIEEILESYSVEDCGCNKKNLG